MTDPPRSQVKQKNQGEKNSSQEETFSQVSLLQYQNKALASFLNVEKEENKKLTKKSAFFEKANWELLSSSALLYQQLFFVNDKLMAIARQKGLDDASSESIREADHIVQNYALFESANLDKIIEANHSKAIIEEVGSKLQKLCDKIAKASGSAAESADDIQQKLEEVTESHQKLCNDQAQHQSLISSLNRKISELKNEKEETLEKLKVLELRANRSLPYVQFEQRHFNVEQIDHKWACNLCGREMEEIIQAQQQEVWQESQKEEESAPQEDVEMAESDVQIKGLQKINEALFEVVIDSQNPDFDQDQQVIKSRAFNRLLRNGKQLLEAYYDLKQTNNDLERKIEEKIVENSKIVEEMTNGFNDTITKFSAELKTNELQMKIAQIEKENLKKELHTLQSINVETLKTTNEELKKAIQVLEDENK